MKNYILGLLQSKKFWELTVLLIVVASLSFSIVYTDVQTYDPVLTPASGYVDTTDYLKVYKGTPESRLLSLRIMVPFFARSIPDLPALLFSPKNRLLLNPNLKIAIKFAVINLFFLIGAGVALYFFQQGFNFNYFQALIGVILFLGSKIIVRSAGLPTADVAFCFFYLLCLIAIQHNNWWFLLLAHTAGIFAKEVIFFSLPMILLALLPWRRKLVLLLCLIPSVVIYSILLSKMGISPVREQITINAPAYANSSIIDAFRINFIWLFNLITKSIRQGFGLNVNRLLTVFLSYGLAWIPALYAIKYRIAPLLLRRWSWIIIFLIPGGLILGNVDRNLFYFGFPVVIPLASLGLSKWLAWGSKMQD